MPDRNGLAELAPQVRTAFDPECLAVYEAMTRSPILSALRLVPSLTQPCTVDVNRDVLESVFGSFGPDHAFHSFTPDWGIELTEPRATKGLESLLNGGEAKLRAARIRAFLEALRVTSLPDDSVLERMEELPFNAAGGMAGWHVAMNDGCSYLSNQSVDMAQFLDDPCPTVDQFRRDAVEMVKFLAEN